MRMLAEIAKFPDRIEKPTQYLPYVEDFVYMGESAIVLKIQEIWEVYHRLVKDLLLGLSRTGDMSSISDQTLAETYSELSEAEKAHYGIVSDYLLNDLKFRLRRSHYPSKELNSELNSVEKRLRRLESQEWKSLDKMRDDYMELMDRLDTINAQMLGQEMESKARFRRRLIALIVSGVVVGVVLIFVNILFQ